MEYCPAFPVHHFSASSLRNCHIPQITQNRPLQCTDFKNILDFLFCCFLSLTVRTFTQDMIGRQRSKSAPTVDNGVCLSGCVFSRRFCAHPTTELLNTQNRGAARPPLPPLYNCLPARFMIYRKNNWKIPGLEKILVLIKQRSPGQIESTGLHICLLLFCTFWIYINAAKILM